MMNSRSADRLEVRSRIRSIAHYSGVAPNFGVKLSRPGFGPAAELPMSSPA
jgi:hypothetical protein